MKTGTSHVKAWQIAIRGSAVFMGLACAETHALAAETRTWVVSWLAQSAYSQPGDCPDGLEPNVDQLYTRVLLAQGETKESAAKLLEDNAGSTESSFRHRLIYRGQINGQPANVYDNPTSTPDPGVHNVVGKYAFGFNLDGKGAASPNSFEDPVTHEKGINNQYFRAMGCFTNHRAIAPERSTHWQYAWIAQRYAMRAWLISVSGEDLGKDGAVTVTFDKALEPVMLDVNSDVQHDQTLRIDSDPRSHNVFQAHLKDGVIALDNGRLTMVGEPFVIPYWNMHDLHLRLTIQPDGKLSGRMGGYQDWKNIFFMYSQGGAAYESMLGLNIPGIYYSLRRMADADPDPKTGQNMSISAAYQLEAVPAILVPETPDIQYVAKAK